MKKAVLKFLKTIALSLPLLNTIACGKALLEVDDSYNLEGDEEVVQIIAEIVEYSPERLFRMDSFGVKGFSSSSQGMDVYKDSILFQAGIFTDKTTLIHIFNLESKKVIGSINFTSPDGKGSHMNNINCGVKYDESDVYPLLYLSQTSNNRYCYVLRIANDALSYELIQTIKYAGDRYHQNGSAHDWFIDLDNQSIYTYGHYKHQTGIRELVKFKLPPLNKAEVVYYDNDVLDNFVLKDVSIYQGSKIIDGLLFTPVGYGNISSPGRLLTIDLEKKAVVKDGTLDCGEPESIGRYKDGVIICGGGGNPYYYYVKP